MRTFGAGARILLRGACPRSNMTTTSVDLPSLSQVEQLLAESGYEVSETDSGVLRVRDLETGIGFQAALEGNVLFMSVRLTTLDKEADPELLQRMLAADNGINTSSFKLHAAADGRPAVTLSNFCKLQNMGPEDCDDILSLAGYLLADSLAAREIVEPSTGAAA